ncbi:hypothetical protein QOT17_002826 [Balamuthia mandrillaris]
MLLTRSNVWGSYLGWTASALLFLSLIIPWYLTSVQVKNAGGGDFTATNVFFWAHAVCTSSGDLDHELVCGDGDVHAFWGDNDLRLVIVFAPTFFLMLFTTVMTLLAAIITSARCCWMKVSSPRTALFAKAAFHFSCFGVIGLTTAIIIFAALLPSAWKASVSYMTEPTHGPWDSFIGHDERELKLSEQIVSNIKLVWAPVGWWIALLAWPFLVGTSIALFTSWRTTNRQHGYSIVNQ